MCPLGFPSFPLAESEGFEPPVRRNAYTTFRVWLFRPLRQLSLAFGNKVAMVNTAYAPLTGDLCCLGRLGLPARLPCSKPKVNWFLHAPPPKPLAELLGAPQWFFRRSLSKAAAKVLLFFDMCKFFCKKITLSFEISKKSRNFAAFFVNYA